MKRYAHTEETIKHLLFSVFHDPKPNVNYTDHPKWDLLIETTQSTNEIVGLEFYKSLNPSMPQLCVPKFMDGFREFYYSSCTEKVAEKHLDTIHFPHRKQWTLPLLESVYKLSANISDETIHAAYDIALKMIKNESNLSILSGPISTGGLGSPAENLMLFNRNIVKAANSGVNVFNQMPFEPLFGRLHEHVVLQKKPGYSGQVFLDHFYGPLLESGKFSTLIQMQGWQSSTGARWEHNKAREVGMEVVQLEDVLVMA